MVCKKCEKKLGSIITPEVWKAGSAKGKEGKKKIGSNALLRSKMLSGGMGKKRASKLKMHKCKLCKVKCHQAGKMGAGK